MENIYTNEEKSLGCISRINTSFGAERRKLLKELCRFRTKAADEFWSSRIKDESYLPYIMMCRSEKFSDYAADRLDDFINRLLNGELSIPDSVNEAYFLFHVCMFKESDKLIEVYRKIARNYKKISAMRINWSNKKSVSPYNQPDFLYKRFLNEYEDNCENTFFNFLTDVLILTAANAVVCDGEHETYTAKLKELYNDYPDVYTSAGFFAYFINDTYEAYDVFGRYMIDPVDYSKLLWVLDGFEYENGVYIQGSPTTFGGSDNEKIHFNLKLPDIDIRWYEFLACKSISDVENMQIQELSYIRNYLKIFSHRVFNLINHNDAAVMDICSGYFRKAAVISGNPVDFAGLAECGVICSEEALESLVMETADLIVKGRQEYNYRIMMHFFKNISRESRGRVLSKAAGFLTENDLSEENAEQRAAFLLQAELYANGQKSVFDI